jgi:signal transduction histidine kinase
MKQWTFNKIIFRFVTTALLLYPFLQANATEGGQRNGVKLEVMVDATQSKSLEDVTKSTFNRFDAREKLPFSHSSVWLRLTPENTQKEQALFLKILPALIAEVTVYVPNIKNPNGWDMQSYKTDQLSEPIPVGSTSLNQDMYVRVSSPLDLRIFPVVESKEKIDRLQRHMDIYIVCIVTILSLASLLTLVRFLIGVNLFSLALFFFCASQTAAWLSGMELMTVATGLDQSFAIGLFPMAFTGTIFSFILVWLLLAHNLFNGGRWIKALSIFLLILGLIFIGSFFDTNKAIASLETVRIYGSWVCALFLAIQAIQSRHLLSNIAEKLTLLFLMVFIMLPIPTSGNLYKPMIDTFTNENLSQSNLIFLFRPVLTLLLLTLAAWSFEKVRSERISSLRSELKITKSNLENESSRLDLQKKFTAMLTHELKNPLMASQMALGSIRDRLHLEDPSIDRVNSIAYSLHEIDTIIERCAEIDKYEQGYIPLVIEKFPLGDLVCIMKASHPNERIYTILRGADDDLVLRSDLYYIKSILNNLLSNALKYSVAESLVELKVEYKTSTFSSEVLFSVSNEVTEDAKLDSTRVFDRYYRSESAKQQSGAGLGLWLAQSMAYALGSNIKLTTQTKYVRFEFSIPV